ncbi:MAG: LysM peptidoglycan-binding domain-containing protein [Myxococcales bacterium]|nr:LysM peptidoglycan-binding domain-containing protein [Myxococcales bacterium]MCB9707500.1 LysM peptidoglycan-binding domain-containing protein [Myxococcales bacterium]
MNRMMLAYGILANLGLAAVATSHSHAQDSGYIYIVKSGDTLASISQRFYGDSAFEKVLVTESGLTGFDGVSIVAGMRLLVPFSSYYRVASGDTWSKLSERFYGTADRGQIIASNNGLSTDSPPEQNAQLLIPYALRHVSDARDDLMSICEAYYGTTEPLASLRKFNRLSRNKLKRSQVILVPMPKLVLSEQGRKIVEAATGSALPDGSIRLLQTQSIQRIAQLRELVRRGRYIEAVAYGNELQGIGALTASQSVVVYSELATAYVALEREDLALKAFKAALALHPELELDTAKTSPKVLLVLKKARALKR